MKIFTYNSLNLKRYSLSCLKIDEEVKLYYFHLQGYIPFYHFKINESIILFFINIPILKKLRLKNNLSKSNKNLRDVITKKMIIKSHLRNGYEK